VEGFRYAGAFLCTLFIILLDYLQNLNLRMVSIRLQAHEMPDLNEGKFWLLMTIGQTFFEQGESRHKFYDEVLHIAEQVCSFIL
jgi:hypothetical protein